MVSSLYTSIDALSREQGIHPQIVVSALEDAIGAALRKYYNSPENLRAELDKESGAIRVFAVKTVVESPEPVEESNLQISLEEARKTDRNAQAGGEVRLYKPPDVSGRIMVHLVKQVIFQKVPDAEHNTVERLAALIEDTAAKKP